MKKLSIEQIESVITTQMRNLEDAWETAKENNDMQRMMSLYDRRNDSGIELCILLDALKQEANKVDVV
tara:strand:- start:119 stop:322 length:204 start_codon:yes stop_codon:yes gene_type:complete